MTAEQKGMAGTMNACRRIVSAYLAVEVVLFALIHVCEIFELGLLTNVSMYASVVLGTIVALWFYARFGKSAGNKRANIIVAGLIATAVSDIFLTLIDTEWTLLPGFVAFCVTEVVYWGYVGFSLRSLVARIGAMIALFALIWSMGELTFSHAVGLIDIALVLCNAAQAWLNRKTGVSLLFAIGITLFFCCDASIAVRILSAGVVHDVSALLVWVFYVPAQVFITMSYVHSVRPSFCQGAMPNACAGTAA